MKEYTLSQQFAIVGLDGLVSNHPSMAKKVAVRGICASRVVEKLFGEEKWQNVSEFKQELVCRIDEIKKYKKAQLLEEEEKMATLLKADGVLEETPDLLGCDMNYQTAGVEIWDYRSERTEYLRVVEGVRAEILETGEVTEECICLLWLFRETGCMHEIFSVEEQKKVEQRMTELVLSEERYRILWDAEFHSGLDHAVVGALKGKRSLFKNPYLKGVNLVFPFLDRRQAIFIDYVILGTTVKERRIAMINHLNENGHYVEEVKNGTETLLRIDNAYYRIFPKVVSAYKIPIQGAQLVPAYR